MSEMRFDEDPHALCTLKVTQWLKKRYPEGKIRSYF